MTRIHILEATQLLLPNCCMICKSSGLQEGRKFVDFSFTLEDYGCIYICVPCYTFAMTTLGFYTKIQFESLRDSFNSLVKHNQKVKEENVRLRSILDNVSFLRDNPPDDYSPDNEVLEDDDADSSDEQKSSGSNSKSGSSDVSDDDTSDDDDAESDSDSGFSIKL